VVAILVGLSLGWFILRSVRRKHDNPKYLPTPFLKNLWTKWEPGKPHRAIPQSDGLEPHRQVGLPLAASSVHSSSLAVDAAIPRPAGVTGVLTSQEVIDRHTSVRSIMTLPAYNPNPLQSEQVLGREGERGGVDVVVEFPEGADEEEASREAEMEALYQVRVARRREIEEREERRRLKREARERGDMVALRELQVRSRAPSNASSAGPSVDEARAEHGRIKKERQRAISSVSYADLGVARHDGTRLRANSNDSEREGLLGNAAIMGGGSYHRRDHSASSVLSADTMNTELPSGGGARSRSGSMLSERPGTLLRRASNRSQVRMPSHERTGSSPEMIEYDDIPSNSPPGYENISLDTVDDGPRSEPPPGYSTSTVPSGESRPTATTPTLDTTPVNTDGRRASASHIGQLLLERVPSNSRASLSAPTPAGERRRSSGGVGTPRVPTLTLPSLPSIHIDPGSPAGSYSNNHPEN
jgi:hypothetical protein